MNYVSTVTASVALFTLSTSSAFSDTLSCNQEHNLIASLNEVNARIDQYFYRFGGYHSAMKNCHKTGKYLEYCQLLVCGIGGDEVCLDYIEASLRPISSIVPETVNYPWGQENSIKFDRVLSQAIRDHSVKCN